MTPFRYVLRAGFRLNGERFLDVLHVCVFHLIGVLGGRGGRAQLVGRFRKRVHRFRCVHGRYCVRRLMIFSSGVSLLRRLSRRLQSESLNKFVVTCAMREHIA